MLEEAANKKHAQPNHRNSPPGIIQEPRPPCFSNEKKRQPNGSVTERCQTPSIVPPADSPLPPTHFPLSSHDSEEHQTYFTLYLVCTIS